MEMRSFEALEAFGLAQSLAKWQRCPNNRLLELQNPHIDSSAGL